MNQRRKAVMELAAPIALALAIGVSVSLLLAGGTLLLAGSGAQVQPGAAAVPAAQRP